MKKILSILVLALFVSYYSSSTLFTHTHNFEWGRVTHSHPYAPQNGHGHSMAAVCSLFANLGETLFVVAAFALITALFALLRCYAVLDVREVESRIVLSCNLRAPPVC